MNLAEELKLRPIDNIQRENEIVISTSNHKVIIKTINTFEYPTTKLLISAIEVTAEDARRFSTELFIDKYGKFVEYSIFTSTPESNSEQTDLDIEFSTLIYKNDKGEDLILVFAQSLNATIYITTNQIL